MFVFVSTSCLSFLHVRFTLLAYLVLLCIVVYLLRSCVVYVYVTHVPFVPPSSGDVTVFLTNAHRTTALLSSFRCVLLVLLPHGASFSLSVPLWERVPSRSLRSLSHFHLHVRNLFFPVVYKFRAWGSGWFILIDGLTSFIPQFPSHLPSRIPSLLNHSSDYFLSQYLSKYLNLPCGFMSIYNSPFRNSLFSLSSALFPRPRPFMITSPFYIGNYLNSTHVMCPCMLMLLVTRCKF